MGYAYYEIIRPDQSVTAKPMKRGYSVECKCHKRGCKNKIDRGLARLCYYCTWYFCADHLTYAYCQHDEPIETDCFAGEGSQMCEKCAKEMEKLAVHDTQFCSHALEV